MRALAAFGVVLAAATMTAAGADKIRIIQTNSAGDSVVLIDPATNKIVGEIKDIEANHGAAAAPDGSRLYVTNEAESTLDVVDAKTLKVVGHVPLSGHPNNLSISNDGRRVYIAIAQAPGAVDVVDTVSMTRAQSIPIDGAGHNTFITPDGRFVVAGSVAGRSLTVIDQATETTAWSMKFDAGVRPIAFERQADGSTSRMFVQLSDLHGFAVVDFATHKEVGRVVLPDVPGATKSLSVQGSPSHGTDRTGRQDAMGDEQWYHFVAAYSMQDQAARHRSRRTSPGLADVQSRQRSPLCRVCGSNSVSVVDVKGIEGSGERSPSARCGATSRRCCNEYRDYARTSLPAPLRSLVPSPACRSLAIVFD